MLTPDQSSLLVAVYLHDSAGVSYLITELAEQHARIIESLLQRDLVERDSPQDQDIGAIHFIAYRTTPVGRALAAVLLQQREGSS
ncbi:MAG: hypothetical protein ABI835_02830 [Chloroflexota bacterium]